MKSVSFQRETFGASRSAEITGMSTMQQRNMRRLGHDTKAASGHERRDARGLAKLRVMMVLSEFGFPPAAVSEIADSASAIVVTWAAQDPKAVSDDGGIAKGEPPHPMPNGAFPRYLVWAGKTVLWPVDIGLFYSEQEAASGLTAAVVLDLRKLGSELIERAGVPLWRVVEIED